VPGRRYFSGIAKAGHGRLGAASYSNPLKYIALLRQKTNTFLLQKCLAFRYEYLVYMATFRWRL
jgi:hypothetical protein